MLFVGFMPDIITLFLHRQKIIKLYIVMLFCRVYPKTRSVSVPATGDKLWCRRRARTLAGSQVIASAG